MLFELSTERNTAPDGGDMLQRGDDCLAVRQALTANVMDRPARFDGPGW